MLYLNKKIIALFCILSAAFNLAVIYADDLDGLEYDNYMDSSYKFEKGKFIEYLFDPPAGADKVKVKTYNLKYRNKIPYLLLDDKDTSSEWLCLFSKDILLMYAKTPEASVRSILAFSGSGSRSERMYFFDDIKASSYLTEGEIIYAPRNLGDRDPFYPWVEGVSGNGIGERLYIDTSSSMQAMHISIGYVSLYKPWLYEMNSRPKKLRITDTKNNVDMIVNLLDTPNPQKINFGSSESRKLIIEILEVYPGTRYEDTCINFILFEA